MNKDVLIVEDDDTTLFMLSNYFKSRGYTVYQAANGQEALQIIVRKQPLYVMLDLNMPVMNGYEFLTRINGMGVKCNLRIFVTSCTENKEFYRIINQENINTVHVHGYFEKPYDMRLLEQQLLTDLETDPTLEKETYTEPDLLTQPAGEIYMLGALKNTHTVGIIEDDSAYRATIENFIAVYTMMDVSFSVAGYNELARNHGSYTRPDVILLDLHLTDIDGIFIIEDLKRMFPGVKIVIMTGDTNEEYLLKAIQHGAASYLYKPFPADQLKSLLAELDQRDSYLEPEMVGKLMTRLNAPDATPIVKNLDRLTRKEVEVLELTKKGYTYKEMAKALNISYYTVNFHLKEIYAKMNVRSRAELIAKFL